MSYFEIERVSENHWTFKYKDGLELKIETNFKDTKKDVVLIIKTLQENPIYNDDEKIIVFYKDLKREEKLASWEKGNNPKEKLFKELKSADIKYKNKEDDPNNIEKNMQTNEGSGETGS